jgi:beta-xylosidase
MLLRAAFTAAAIFITFAPRCLADPPLFDGADPDVYFDRQSKSYFVYPTNTTQTPQQDEFKALYTYSSSDLARWRKLGPIFKLQDVRWLEDKKDRQLWAPGIFHDQKAGGKYYLYYSVGPQHPSESYIGVASAADPSGPFIDSGKPLIKGRLAGGGKEEFEAIDAMVFRDPATGRIILYCGGSAGDHIEAYELNDDLVTVKKQLSIDTPRNFTEGAFMHYRQGRYYLSYSHGHWDKDDYCVCYSTSNSPLGPWTYKGKILETDAVHTGPGHHSILSGVDGHDYVFYHRWNEAKKNGVMPRARSVAVASLKYDEKGDIVAVMGPSIVAK